MDFPTGFRLRMKRYLGDETDAFFAALCAEPERSFRFDPEKTDAAELAALFGAVKKVPFAEHALYFSYDKIGHHPLHHGGAVYVQEPAAMAPIAALGGKRFSAILDLCAAPGGKSLQAARACLEKNGILVSNEPDARRRRVLMQNVERLGEKRVVVTGFDARHLPKEFEGAFDLVILDAPCSGEGMMRKSEDALRLWSEENIALCAERQKALLDSAAAALKGAGVLVYSTCTWAVEENEGQIDSFLNRHSNFLLTDVAEAVRTAAAEGIRFKESQYPLEKTCRFYPHRFAGEGQFLAVLQKTGDAVPTAPSCAVRPKKEKWDSEKETVIAFLQEVLSEKPNETLLCRNGEWYLVPEMPFSTELFHSPGILIGTVRKNRVIPHHRFFLAMADGFCQRITLDDEEAKRYLRGEELVGKSGSGWCAVYWHRCPLGGAKVSGGVAKNYYPKGLRREG